VSLLQQRLAAITDTAANLKAQLFELERLREQIRKALLSAENSRNRNGGTDAALSRWKSTVTLPAATEWSIDYSWLLWGPPLSRQWRDGSTL
jgi:hypothetical protein